VGAGKSSLLRSVKERLTEDNRKDIVVLEEPIEEWLRISDGENNIMHLFYETPRQYAFAFQTLVAVTTMRAIWRAVNENPEVKVIICERSLFSSRKVFAEALKDDGALDELEMEVYENLFADEDVKWMYPEEILYLDTSPEVCLERIRIRNRVEEGEINIKWLQKYKGYYEEALYQRWEGTPIVIDGDTSNPQRRKEWVEEVLEWCGRVIEASFPEEVSKNNEGPEEEIGQVLPIDASPRERKHEEIPIKARFEGHTQHVGNRGDTLKEVEESIRHYFPQIGDREALIKWKEVGGGPWLTIHKEEEWRQAMDTICQQGRPVARLVIIVSDEEHRS